MIYKAQYGKELEKVLQAHKKNHKKFHELLIDLLTPAEYKDLAVRWQIVKQLNKKISQRKISKSLGVSVATITRGSRELLNKKGGFNSALSCIK
jgi:TrpR family transcriptional regulator, trp operon repressor